MEKIKFFGLSLLLLALLNSELLRAQGDSYIIVHVVNPEGVEIASIKGLSSIYHNEVDIYIDDQCCCSGIRREEDCNWQWYIPPGEHIIKVKFNGKTLEESVNITPEETKRLVFVFPREEIDIKSMLYSSCTDSFSDSFQWTCVFFGTTLRTAWDHFDPSVDHISVHFGGTPGRQHTSTIEGNANFYFSPYEATSQVYLSTSVEGTGDYKSVQSIWITGSYEWTEETHVPASAEYSYWYLQNEGYGHN